MSRSKSYDYSANALKHINQNLQLAECFPLPGPQDGISPTLFALDTVPNTLSQLPHSNNYLIIVTKKTKQNKKPSDHH